MLSAFLIFGCSTMSHKDNKPDYPDEIVIYKIPQFTNYLVGVKCAEVKSRGGTSALIITDKKEIGIFYSLFEDAQNFVVDTFVTSIDSRILFEYRKKGKPIKNVCWANVKRIQKDGAIYTYNKAIEDYLLSKKLIIVFTTDTIK